MLVFAATCVTMGSAMRLSTSAYTPTWTEVAAQHVRDELGREVWHPQCYHCARVDVSGLVV